MLAANALAGSSFTRTTAGRLKIATQDGTVCYHGKACPDAIQAAFSEEHEQVRYAIHNWLRSADVFSSGWNFIPVNSPQVFLSIKPRGAGIGRV